MTAELTSPPDMGGDLKQKTPDSTVKGLEDLLAFLNGTKDVGDIKNPLKDDPPGSASTASQLPARGQMSVNFKILIQPALTRAELKKLAEAYLDKKGAPRELKEIITEIVMERIQKNGNPDGASGPQKIIDSLLYGGKSPEISKKRGERALARQFAASAAEGATLAHAMRHGVKSIKRPLKPVRFK